MTGKSLAQTETRIEKNTLDFLMTDLGLRELPNVLYIWIMRINCV